MITVFYDGKCGLCRREIEHYIKIAPVDVFHWVDVTIDQSTIKALNIAYADALRQLHVQDEQGNMHIGVDAFIVIWKHIPRWRILSKIASLPIIRPIANKAYKAFASWRFKKLGYDQCQL